MFQIEFNDILKLKGNFAKAPCSYITNMFNLEEFGQFDKLFWHKFIDYLK